MTGSNIPDEFKSAEDMTKHVFGIMDTNSDNQISLEEFLEGARKAQIIVDILQSFIGGGNLGTGRKPPTCRKSLTNLSHNVVHLTLIEIRTHNISGDRH
jgi:hypothetical protein